MRAKRFILTYSQLADSFNRDGLGEHLKSLCPDFECISISVEEHPKTGGHHIHVYLDSGKPTGLTINDPLFFDYCEHHPNIKGIQVTPHKAYRYCTKDGVIIFEEGEPPETPSKTSGDDKWSTIMAASTKEEFLKSAMEHAPRDTVLHFQSLQSFADWKYRDNPEDYSSCEMTCHCEEYPQLTEWVQTNLHSPVQGRPKSLIIWGPSLTGKTLWARSLGKHAYFPGLFMLEGFNADEVQYAVFDDLLNGIHTIPNFKFWLGGQREFVIGDKYMRKQRIKWGKPSILIGNNDPREGVSSQDKLWLEANCIFVEITGTLSEPYLE
jgi:Geminivirus rep protein central domain